VVLGCIGWNTPGGYDGPDLIVGKNGGAQCSYLTSTCYYQLIFQANGTATVEQLPPIPAFDHLPKRVRKEKKAASTPEIHIHFPPHFNAGASSSTQVDKAPEVVSADEEAGEPSPSAFKTEANYAGWEY
jgi:hypothetical protein